MSAFLVACTFAKLTVTIVVYELLGSHRCLTDFPPLVFYRRRNSGPLVVISFNNESVVWDEALPLLGAGGIPAAHNLQKMLPSKMDAWQHFHLLHLIG